MKRLKSQAKYIIINNIAVKIAGKKKQKSSTARVLWN